MYSKDIKKVKSFIDRGQYEKAVQLLNNISQDKEIEILIMNSMLEREQGRKIDLDLANKAVELAKKSDNDIYQMMAYSNLIIAIDKFGSFDKLTNLNENITELMMRLQSQELENEENKSWIKATYLTAKAGCLVFGTGKRSESIDILNQTCDLWQDLGEEAELARCYHYLSRVNLIEQSIHYAERAVEIWTKLGNQNRLAYAKCYLGSRYIHAGDFNEAVKYNSNALEISEKLGDLYVIANANECLGTINYYQGEPLHSISKLEKSEHIWRKLESEGNITASLEVLGESYYATGNLEKARLYFQEVIDISEKNAVNPDFILRPLLQLLLIAINQENNSVIESIKQKISDTCIENPSYIGKVVHQISEALFLKNSPKLRDKMQAQAILEQFPIDDVNLPWAYKIIVLKSMCELLLLEAEFQNDVEVFSEVNELVEKILSTAKEQHIQSLQIESLIFLSKLNLISGKLNLAKNLLEEAEKISLKNNLTLMNKLVLREKQQLETNYKKWMTIVESDNNIREKLREAKIKEYLKSAISWMEGFES